MNAKDLVRTGFSLARSMHGIRAEEGLDFDTCERLIASSRVPALEGSVWLLSDGLDEVSADERRTIRELAHDWKGPVIFCARPLPGEVAGVPHLRIEPLDEGAQKRLLELLGKPEHAKILTHEEPGSLPPERPRIRDGRQEMLADFRATPAGALSGTAKR